MSREGAPNRRARRAMVKGVGSGVVLDRQPEDGQRRYPLVNEFILHHCGVNVVPMEDGACMLRFPSSNGLCCSVPLSPEGLDDLVAQIEAARAGQPVAPSGTVDGVVEPSDDQPSTGSGGSQ